MNHVEQQRSAVLHKIVKESITFKAAARTLRITDCHLRRIWKRFCEEREQSLINKNTGRPWNRVYPSQLRSIIVQKYQELSTQRGSNIGPTRFTKLLSQEGIYIDHETCRRWFIESDMWRPKKRKFNQSAMAAC